jgi:hypothetical protein
MYPQRLMPAVRPLFALVTPAKFRSIRTTEIAEAMVAPALHPPMQSGIYNYSEMLALRRARHRGERSKQSVRLPRSLIFR